MVVTMIQHEYPPGTTIKIGEYMLVVLEYCVEYHGLVKVALINWDSEKERFGDTSDWGKSSLRQKLNYGETYEQIKTILGSDRLYFFLREIITIDGVRQRSCYDVVSLLTIEEYAKYKALIMNKFSGPFWLLTPRSTKRYGDELSVFYVLKNGLVDFQISGFKANILPIVTTDASIFTDCVVVKSG